MYRAYLEWLSTHMLLFQLSKRRHRPGSSPERGRARAGNREPGPGLLPQGLCMGTEGALVWEEIHTDLLWDVIFFCLDPLCWRTPILGEAVNMAA